jgi:tRNA pseudouridine13 synthase
VKLKLSPEDFKVDELARWDEDPKGRHAVYRVRKRKLTTFDAVRLIAARCRVPLDRVSYIGLKDRQGVTTQYLSVEDAVLKGRVPGVHYELVGRTSKKLSGENLLGNEFTIVVRDLGPEDVSGLEANVAAVKRHGLPDYFDDQRFGSVAAGQGFPARELVRGHPEAALKLLLATPGARDPLAEKKWKFLVSKLWGKWDELARKWSNRPGAHVVRHLRRKPLDFAGAWSHMPGKERAIHIFAYQSYVWNESVAGFLRQVLPKKKLLEIPYVAGRQVFWTHSADEELPSLPETFPLVDDATPLADERISLAVDAALRREGLTRASFKIQGISGSFFKHEERPLVLRPERLVLARAAGPDERFPGRLACALSFRLPPGGYATLVLKRLFPRTPSGAKTPAPAKARRGPRRGPRAKT